MSDKTQKEKLYLYRKEVKSLAVKIVNDSRLSVHDRLIIERALNDYSDAILSAKLSMETHLEMIENTTSY